jgi:ABC-type multidrug transport system fused ATPase/permease subunit
VRHVLKTVEDTGKISSPTFAVPAFPRRSSPKRRHGEFWRACGFLAPYRLQVIVAVASAFCSGLIFTGGLSAIYPIINVLLNNQTVRQMVDEKVTEQLDRNGSVSWYWGLADRAAQYVPDRPVYAIATLFGLILVLAVIGNVFRFCHEYLSDRSAISAINDIRKRLYDQILHLPLGYFGKHGTSDVTSRLVSDAQSLQEGFKTVLGQAVAEPIKAVLALLLAAVIDWRLTLFIIVFAPLMAVMIKKFGKKVRRASREALKTSAHMLGQIEGTLVGIRVVKSANAERFERRRYSAIMSDLRKDQLRMARYEAFSTPTLETLGMLAIGCVLIVASWLIFEDKSLDKGGFLLVLACLVGIGESLRRVSKLNNVLQRSNGAASRIFELLDLPIERQRQTGVQDHLIPLRCFKNRIVFEDVCFQYPGTHHLAIDHLTLEVQKGQSVAIVGRNGSGKTTLLSLLPRFFEPEGGRILIDGIDIRQFTLPTLRRAIAIVTQDPVIFPGTIAENIAYGQPNLSRQQIESAAKEAFAHEFIMQKPLGYDTPLGGLGAQLSGGQKQRLNIARAILRNSPILILDEATSQVDAESEHLIQQAIERLMHERTTFVIAHRFSTILAADTIVVMDQGRIVGQGKHNQLLDNCPTYKQLYERQLVAAG